MDKKIMELLQRRSEQALAEIEQQYGKRLKSIAYSVLKNADDADECVNDTLLKAWNAIPPAAPEHLFAYLARICRNAATDRCRRQNSAKRSARCEELSAELEQCIPDSVSSCAIEARELEHSINAFLERLPQESRTIFLRRYWFGDSVREIAERLDCSEAKVKTALFRLRRQLKEALETEGFVL